MNAPHRRKEWLEFKDWCGQRKLRAFPAHPWTVSAYLLWLEANRRYRTLNKRLDIIARVHLRSCVHSPESDALVKRTLNTIERRRKAGPHKSFTGKELLAPKKRAVKFVTVEDKKTLSPFPPLVSKRPQTEV